MLGRRRKRLSLWAGGAVGGGGGGVTWDAANKHPNVSLSNGDKTMSVIDWNGGAVRSVQSMSSGKWYIEFRWIGNVIQNYFGVAPSTFDVTTATGGDADHYFVERGNSDSAGGARVQANSGAWCAIAVDYTAQKLWVRTPSSGWVTGDPAAGTNAFRGTGSEYGDANLGNDTLYLVGFCYGDDPDAMSLEINADEATFQYAMPSGFSAWGT